MDKEVFRQKLEAVIELLYQQNMQNAYRGMTEILPMIEAIIGEQSAGVQVELTQVMKDALEAMEQGDMTLLADILQYDLLERIEEF